MRVFIAGVACGILGMALLAGTAVLFWPWQIEATATPSGIEVSLMRRMLEHSLARESPRQENPFPPSVENLEQGLKIFKDTCAGCHGDGVQKSPWGSTSFLPRVPQFGSAPPRRPEWQIHWIVSHGLRNTAMGGFAQILSDEQIWKVSAFLSHIDSLPEGVAAEWRKGAGS